MKKNELKKGHCSPFLLKFLITMKLSILFLCLSVLTVMASETYSQTTKLSLSLQNVTLEKVFNG